MNQLQVKTINLKPAVVEFNFDELSEVLDQQLAKYEGLEFTEKDVAACKKTITELNKGKKALNDYRLKTKKELTVSVTEFENKCKELATKFDSVIIPLKEQHDQFEEKRKEIKRLEIEGYIDHLVHTEDLNEKFAAQLVIEDSYLTKSKTMKSIKEELETQAHHLGVLQDKEESDIQIIKMSVEIANEKFGVELLDSTYIRLLEHESIEKIKILIRDDAQHEAKKNEEYEKVPLSSAPASVSIDEKLFKEVYKVTATESQLDALEEFMNREDIDWIAVEE